MNSKNPKQVPLINNLTRRNFLKWSVFTGAIAGTATALSTKAMGCLECVTEKWNGKYDIPGITNSNSSTATLTEPAPAIAKSIAGLVTTANKIGEMNPAIFLETFDYGKVTKLPNGQIQREYQITATDKEVEVATGVYYPAWTYNGFVPGPTLRATEGDHLKIHFTNNSSMEHTIHFHGIHPAGMDGVFEIVPSGGTFTYEFEAEPFGLFLYHCHVMPLKKHIEKGLYGTFIVDPKTPRPPAREFVMVMNGFDTDFNGENEFYTVNGFANYFAEHPIDIQVNEKIRIYLVNITEFDLINSLHIHANMFHVYRTGTNLTPDEFTDTVMLCQGERCILEFSYKFPGMYMFHAHQSEFAELGWMGFFNVQENKEMV